MLPTPAPGFDDPLALLRACHERIQRQCATLAKLVVHLRNNGLTDDARQAAADIHRYFTSAGRQHHADEEQDLFPLLRSEPAPSALSALSALLDALAREHAVMESLWLRLEPLLAAPDTIHDLAAFSQLTGEFNVLYRQHIARENSELLPQAERLLSVEQQRVLGARMAARRGVSL